MTTKDELYPTVKLEARLMDDGTLWIKSDRLTDINRVIVEDGKTYCKQFYMDAQPEIIRCKDCKWWTKQEASLQGRCALMGTYPTGEWFCGNARRGER